MKQIPCFTCAKTAQEMYLYTECQHFLCLQCAIKKVSDFDQTHLSSHNLKCCGLQTKIEEQTFRMLNRRRQSLQNIQMPARTAHRYQHQSVQQTLYSRSRSRSTSNKSNKSNKFSRAVDRSRSISRQKQIKKSLEESNANQNTFRGSISKNYQRKEQYEKIVQSFDKNNLHGHRRVQPRSEFHSAAFNSSSRQEQFKDTLIDQLNIDNQKYNTTGTLNRKNKSIFREPLHTGNSLTHQLPRGSRPNHIQQTMDHSQNRNSFKNRSNSNSQQRSKSNLSKSANSHSRGHLNSHSRGYLNNSKDDKILISDDHQQSRARPTPLDCTPILGNLQGNCPKKSHQPIMSFSREQVYGTERSPQEPEIRLSSATQRMKEQFEKDLTISEMSLESILSIQVDRVRREFNYLHKKLYLKEEQIVSGLFNLYEAETKALLTEALVQNQIYCNQMILQQQNLNTKKSTAISNINLYQKPLKKLTDITPADMERVNSTLERYIKSFKIQENSYSLFQNSQLVPNGSMLQSNCQTRNNSRAADKQSASQQQQQNWPSETIPWNSNSNSAVLYSRSTGNLLSKLNQNQSKMKEVFTKHYLSSC